MKLLTFSVLLTLFSLNSHSQTLDKLVEIRAMNKINAQATIVELGWDEKVYNDDKETLDCYKKDGPVYHIHRGVNHIILHVSKDKFNSFAKSLKSYKINEVDPDIVNATTKVYKYKTVKIYMEYDADKDQGSIEIY